MDNKFKIPTNTLPKGWKQIGAEHFGVSTSMIEKVVYGLSENAAITTYMLGLAEAEQRRKADEASELSNRINALTK